MNINKKTVLLTGATGGIGSQIAAQLDALGARLILVGRNQEKLHQLQQSLPQGERHIYLSIDLGEPDGIAQLQQQMRVLAQDDIRTDIIINNAGCNQFSYLAQQNPATLMHEVQLNLVTPMLISQSAIHWLNRPGIILNIGSAFGSIGFPGYTSYCAAKAGLHRFSEALDRELNGSGIRVLYLAPRATNTKLNNVAVQELNQALGNQSDEPEVVASQVIKVLHKETGASWIGWPEKLFVRINQLFPALVSHSINKQQTTIHRYLDQLHNKL